MMRLPVPRPTECEIQSPPPFACVRQNTVAEPALHLPVAPRCNMQCVYCERGADCVHHSLRGNAAVLLTMHQALAYAVASFERGPRIGSVGITGPGDPLANAEATLGVFSLLRKHQPEVPYFLATNGLGILDHVDDLVRLGVGLCIVTVNAVEPRVLVRMIESVQGPEGLIEGDEAARYLLERQLAGIRALADRGVTVRVNFTLIPSVNDDQAVEVARRTSEAGARFFHVVPFEPPASRDAPFGDVQKPDKMQVLRARESGGQFLGLVRHCHLCSSDSLGCARADETNGLRAALEASSKMPDEPSRGDPSGPSSEPPPELGIRGVGLRQLQLIAKVARWLSTSEGSTDETLRRVLVWLDEELGLKRAVIALVDSSGEALSAQVTHDVDPAQRERMRYRLDEGVTGQVFTTGKSLLLPSLQAEASFLDRSGLRTGLDLSRLAFFCVPLRDQGTVIGTLSADKDNGWLKDADSDLRFLEEIAQLLAPFVQRRRLEESLSLFRRLRSQEGPFARLMGRSSAMEEVRRLIAKVAPASTSVLLTGETGTGKSAAAALVHELSPRATGPFIEVNCGAIPETLIESELFGHERGAFTGAVARRAGVFERARGGTVFLDEIGELGPSAQTRLLRVLQTHRFERVGGTETLTTDARLIAATNKDLAAAVADGTFRADLYYRLNVFPVVMPPLRERGKADLMLLADSFIDRFKRAMSKPIFRIDTPAIDMITAYHWPGNVRELENVIERAVVLAEGEVIHGHHLPPSLQMNRYAATPEPLDFNTRVASFETELIIEALKDTGGNQTKAAERLGITKRIIQYKIKTYGIPWQRFVTRA